MQEMIKRYKGIIACAIATLTITLLATIHLHGITFTLTKYGNSFHESEKWVLFTTKETNAGANFQIIVKINNSSAHTQHSNGIKAPQDCKKRNCLEHLSDEEKHGMDECAGRIRTRDHYNGPRSQSDCKFLPNTGRQPVALVSARGSGNTWTRGLLEKATGVCTGFIFCDTVMRAHGYIGENVRSGKVLVVKTHSVVPKWLGEKNPNAKRKDANYTSAVLILRNPAKSAIAEWNRRSAETVLGKHNFSVAQERHTYSVPKQFFGKSFCFTCSVHVPFPTVKGERNGIVSCTRT